MKWNGVYWNLGRWVLRGLALVVLWGGITACGDLAERRKEAVDTLTERQRDSLLSTMPVPGAGAVGKAMEAADRARERARQHDTMGQ
jgi:hypothetical protein